MLMAVEIDQVQAFVAVVRGGGFTRAAVILHLSQPAVSRRLVLLERELGAPLFERIRSGVILTEAGPAVLPPAPGVLAGEGERRATLSPRFERCIRSIAPPSPWRSSAPWRVRR